MSAGSRVWFPVTVLTLVAGLALVPGCQLPAKRSVPFTPPVATPLAPADDPCCRPWELSAPLGTALSWPADGYGPFDSSPSNCCPMRRPRNVLALSGGGSYGAYTAGFLGGWSQSGTRPELDVVTGISTGSLIAPFAFLGSEHDDRLGKLYTRVQAADIFRIRSWVCIPYKDSVASSAPLKALIESQVTQDLMNRIAAEHRKGRRLYVGTTNIDTRRLVVWDMGAIACRPCPEGCQLFRDVLLASCAVPGVLPPVRFELDVDGKKVTELHVDGGVTAQLFVPSHVFAAASAGAAEDAKHPQVVPPGGEPGPPPDGGNLYIVVAGKVFPDAAPVRARVLPVLGASTGSLIYAHCRADLANLYGLSRASGMRYHLTALRPGYQAVENSVDFDRKQMQKLFAEGVAQGQAGPDWMHGPPTLSPGDGDYIRTGVKLRAVPPVVPTVPGN